VVAVVVAIGGFRSCSLKSPSFTAQVRRLTEPSRTCANAIKINWQCGGQGSSPLSSTLELGPPSTQESGPSRIRGPEV
jgi:hypothetical protein